MKAIFVEMPSFSRHRREYLDDQAFANFQESLMQYPEMGDVVANSGGLRKVRYGDALRGKGKRGGLRVIYCWWLGGEQFWLFSLYNKDELEDLNDEQRKLLKQRLQLEMKARTPL